MTKDCCKKVTSAGNCMWRLIAMLFSEGDIYKDLKKAL
jgi:hypothetical protein